MAGWYNGGMAFTVADIEDFIAVLRQHPDWRSRVRDEIIGEDMRAMHARFDRLEAALDKTTEDYRYLWDSAAALEARTARMELRLDSVDVHLVGIDKRFDGVEARLDRVEGKVGNLEGSDYERRFNAASRLGRPYRRPRVLVIGDVEEILEARDSGTLTDADMTQLAALDFLVRARRGTAADAVEVYIAFEVSQTVDVIDVQRAAERAALLARAGLESAAFAGGQAATMNATALADELGVTLVLDRSSSPAA